MPSEIPCKSGMPEPAHDSILVQWIFFGLTAKKFEATRYVPVYPLMALAHAVFSLLLAVQLAFIKPQAKWS